MAAQKQAIRTNAIKAKTDKTQAKSKCRLCGKVDETVRYIMWLSYGSALPWRCQENYCHNRK